MLQQSLERFVDGMIKSGHCKESEKELIVYGLLSAIEMTAFILTCAIISISFGLFWEGLLFLISFWFIRSYAGGFHCKSAIICYISSCSTIAMILYFVKFTEEHHVLSIVLSFSFVAIPMILKFAPLDTPTKPLDEVEKIHFKKKTISHLVVEYVVISLLLITGQRIFALVMTLAVFLSSMVLLAELVRRTFAGGDSHSGKYEEREYMKNGELL